MTNEGIPVPAPNLNIAEKCWYLVHYHETMESDAIQEDSTLMSAKLDVS
jgi:hypothetical protein